VDLRFPGFVANLKRDCMAETAWMELGKNQKFGDDCPKNDFNFAGNFRKSTI